MVIIAAAVCAGTGRVYVSRQFLEISRAHIDEHLSTFKILLDGRPVGFSLSFSVVESESVRFVYRKLIEPKYEGVVIVLLITTKNENILVAKKCLELTVDVMKERCMFFDEKWVLKHSLDLVLAFDEMVSMGYVVDVDMGAVVECLSMESEEENRQRLIRNWQEMETRKLAERRTKDQEKEARANSAVADTDVVSYSTFGSYTLEQDALKPSTMSIKRPP
ncbi:hypothetical protein RvY_15184 [Ramazzottius varieornatus]|uniref:Coatomer subunit delta n=1 Tax=Ramazzottius varieornatus TaxID=947166 RepID=A0A1D1VU06_RAMVA|nr:hypothetical protein RvY_15184 [Ramazzottius varieornatus]